MATGTAPIEAVAERVRAAFARRDLEALRTLFAPEARWGNCVGGEQIVAFMQSARAEGLETALADVDLATDRIVVTLDLRRSGADALQSDGTAHHLVAFVAGDRIFELRDVGDLEEARRAQPSAPEPSPLGTRTMVTTAAAIFPVRNLAAALEHYRRLGFTAHAYEGGGYGFVERGNVEMHLGETPDLDPSANLAAVYLFVEDAAALHAEWEAAGVAGELIAPTDTDYGMHEGAHVDPDGNRIRFGSPRHR
jgi:hypothetical protein